MPEDDHISAPRLADRSQLRVEQRQAQVVGELADHDEIAIHQPGHHGLGGDAKRLEQERAEQQHYQEDGEQRSRLDHEPWLGNRRIGDRRIGGSPSAGPVKREIDQQDCAGHEEHGNEDP